MNAMRRQSSFDALSMEDGTPFRSSPCSEDEAGMETFTSHLGHDSSPISRRQGEATLLDELGGHHANLGDMGADGTSSSRRLSVSVSSLSSPGEFSYSPQSTGHHAAGSKGSRRASFTSGTSNKPCKQAGFGIRCRSSRHDAVDLVHLAERCCGDVELVGAIMESFCTQVWMIYS